MALTKNARIEAYINDVCSQIKFREVHPEIKLELEAHIHDIVNDYLSKDFSEDEAVDKAIAQMGQAAIVGKQLNKIHKAKPEWSILSISLFFVITGLLSMFFIEKQGLFTTTPIHIFICSLVYTIIGVVITTVLYLFDYRKLELYSKQIYLSTILILVFVIIFGQRVNGKPYLDLGLISIDIVKISPILFSISLAGILKKWIWNKPKKFFQGLLLCVIPLILILSGGSITASIIYTMTCITLMIVSGAGKRTFLLMLGLLSGMIIPAVTIYPFKLAGLIEFINPGSQTFSNGYINNQLSLLINSSGPFGQGFTLKSNIMPPGLHTEFIFSYMVFTFGWIAIGILAALAVIFIIRMSHVARIAKNNYAKMLISGFITIFVIQFLWNILMNLGFAPISEVDLPFISFGGSQLIFNAAMLGVISSIYRRRNISQTLIGS